MRTCLHWPPAAAQRSHDRAGPQVPAAPELDAALAAAATPRSGGILLQAVLVQELERHASLAACVRRDADALERMLGGRTANTKRLADCARALLAGQVRRPEVFGQRLACPTIREGCIGTAPRSF